VNPETLERFANRFCQIWVSGERRCCRYMGLAEASLGVTFSSVEPIAGRVERVEREAFTAPGDAPCRLWREMRRRFAFVSSGKSFPGHDVMIVDERGSEVPERVEGFLWFSRTLGDQRLFSKIPRRRKS